VYNKKTSNSRLGLTKVLGSLKLFSKEKIPTEFLSLHIPAGLYAQFEVTAPPTAAKEVFEFIYGEWLPTSGYQLAHRHQLEVIPHDYMQHGDRAQETIWIPIAPISNP
jgi:AraC family transcriptional regulator